MTLKLCKSCGIEKEETEFYKDNRKNCKTEYRCYCKKCDCKYTTKWIIDNKNKDTIKKRIQRYNIKKRIVDYFGGKCSICGYDKYLCSLDFHHLDPKIKEFAITRRMLKFEKILEEAKKCILVCKNCHNEIHHKQEEEKTKELLILVNGSGRKKFKECYNYVLDNDTRRL